MTRPEWIILAALTCAAMTWAMTTSAGWLDRRWGR